MNLTKTRIAMQIPEPQVLNQTHNKWIARWYCKLHLDKKTEPGIESDPS